MERFKAKVLALNFGYVVKIKKKQLKILTDFITLLKAKVFS